MEIYFQISLRVISSPLQGKGCRTETSTGISAFCLHDGQMIVQPGVAHLHATQYTTNTHTQHIMLNSSEPELQGSLIVQCWRYALYEYIVKLIPQWTVPYKSGGGMLKAENYFTIITLLEVWAEVNSSICESRGDLVSDYRDTKNTKQNKVNSVFATQLRD